MRLSFLIPALLSAMIAVAEDPRPVWDMEKLSHAPQIFPAPGFERPGLKALFFEGLPYKGKPTRVFAWIGLPEGASKDKKVPAMVLVHGGGGTAFENWVKLWTGRGYAAISMDTCGALPGGEHSKRPRSENGGPPGWGGFDQIGEPLTDQWTCHAVADVILAHSLLRSLPEVDSEKIGLTGISWGGYLTCIVSGVDSRFKCAVPVYGCGYLGDNSAWLADFKKMGAENAARWLSLWDPAAHLPRITIPTLWVTGTNDFAYPMDSLQKSYRLPKAPHFLAIRPRMPHGHGPAGENPEEIRIFADSFFKNGKALPAIVSQAREGNAVSVKWKSETPILKAELHYTLGTGSFKERKWVAAPATIDAASHSVKATLPDGVKMYFINITDDRQVIASSEHVEL